MPFADEAGEAEDDPVLESVARENLGPICMTREKFLAHAVLDYGDPLRRNPDVAHEVGEDIGYGQNHIGRPPGHPLDPGREALIGKATETAALMDERRI